MKTKYFFLLIMLVAIIFFINGCKAQDKQAKAQKTVRGSGTVHISPSKQIASPPLPESSGDVTLQTATGVPLGPLFELGTYTSPGRNATIVMKGQNEGYFVILDGKTISCFKVAQYKGENTSLVRQYTVKHPGFLSLVEFVDDSHMQMIESTETKGQITKTKVIVLGPDEQKDKVWVAARDYMEGKGRHVGLKIGDRVLSVGAIFDNRAVVIYGPYASEPSAEILLERYGDGNWRVDTDQPLYSTNNELSGEAMQSLALQEGLVFGTEPGKMAIGVKEQGPDRFTFIVGKYGWPWSVEYDLEKADGAWNIAEKRDVK